MDIAGISVPTARRTQCVAMNQARGLVSITLMASREVEIHYDEDVEQIKTDREEGVEIPLDRINPETLTRLISEFVTREWEEVGDASYTLDQKIEQVRQQLQERKAKLVFDLATNTCNIVV